MTRFEIDLGSEPVLRRAAGGTWMAVTGPDMAIRLAVMGLDQEDAKDRFRAELRAWDRLLNQVDDSNEKTRPEA